MTSLDRAMKKAFERRDQGRVNSMVELGSAIDRAEESATNSASGDSEASRQTADTKRELFVDAPENRLRGLHQPPKPAPDQRPADATRRGRREAVQSVAVQSVTVQSVTAASVALSDRSPIEFPSKPANVESSPPVDVPSVDPSRGLAVNPLLSYEMAVTGPVLATWPLGDDAIDVTPEENMVPRYDAAPTSSARSDVAQPFKPVWETDAFRLTPICQEIPTRLQVPLHVAAVELMENVVRERPVIAISGMRRGAGATTVSIVLAHTLAKMGWKVVVVDFDAESDGLPLGDQLGVAIEGGWNSAIATRLDPAECCVQSLADGFCLLPLDRTSPYAATSRELAELLRHLVGGFDVVLLDCGSQIGESQRPPVDLVAARILVQDGRVEVDARGGPAESAMQPHAAGGIHVVENFAVELSR